MIHRSSCIVLYVAAVLLTACADRSGLERQAQAATTRQLIGVWDARFHLDRAPVLTVTPGPATKDVEGQLAFLANRWVEHAYPHMESPSDYGTYDMDFTPFGFDPRQSDEPPTVVAGWTGKDSVEMILGASEGGTVTMVGRIRGDSINGAWTVLVSRAGGGGGSFRLVRHR